jgi:hypothetical protein
MSKVVLFFQAQLLIPFQRASWQSLAIGNA